MSRQWKKTVYTDSSDSIVVHTGKLLAVSCNSLISDHVCCIKSVRSVVVTRVSTHSAHYYQNALSKYVSKGQLKGTECTKLLNSPVITNNTWLRCYPCLIKYIFVAESLPYISQGNKHNEGQFISVVYQYKYIFRYGVCIVVPFRFDNTGFPETGMHH